MRKQKLKLIFEMDSISAREVWDILMELRRRFGKLSTKLAYNSEDVDLETIEAKLDAGAKGYEIVDEYMSYHFGKVANYKQNFLILEQQVAEPIEWQQWIEPFIDDRLVMAWIADLEYDYWQNAEDPLEYEVKGRDYSHLPMKSNGLPPPVEQTIIDTSNNPGRWLFHVGYIEVVGSTMWFGPKFWEKTPGQREAIEAKYRCSQMGEMLKVVFSESCFCDESTAPLQNEIRDLLFPRKSFVSRVTDWVSG